MNNETIFDAGNLGPEHEPDLSILADPSINHDEPKKLVVEPDKLISSDMDQIQLLCKMPAMDVEFKFVEGPATKLVTLKDVEQQITRDNKIDIRTADIVNEHFKTLFECHQRSGYTQLPTKTNYLETKTYMRNVISKEEYALMDLFKTYIETPFKEAGVLMTLIKETHLPGLIRITSSLISEISENIETIQNNPNNTIPLADGIFVDLTKVDLLQFNTSLIRTDIKSIVSFTNAVQAVQNVFQCPYVVEYFNRVLERDEKTVSMQDLTLFITNPRMLQNLEADKENVNAWLSKFSMLVEEAAKIAESPEKVSEFVVDHTADFLGLHKSLTRYAGLVYNLTLLNLAIKQMKITYLEL